VTATILDGAALAKQLQGEIAQQVAEFIENTSTVPRLDVVLVGDDPASEVYVRNKQRDCDRVGIISELHKLGADATTDDVLAIVGRLNRDAAVHGILVQLPLPEQVDAHRVVSALDPTKDVDGLHTENVGRLIEGRPRFVPCTPLGVCRLLERNGVDIAGKHVVILGRSQLVGRPLAALLTHKGPGGDATVTLCHSRTRDLAKFTRQADVLIAAIGRPGFVTADMVKPAAVVVDVGINRTVAGLVGDVDFERVAEIAGMITPVPGGVGPLTRAMLLENCLEAARLQLT
jgi:methylenetetrahydrofolate dehydrogenase (NADP+)/methenyltetrahydrofolate cyclohydrolase